MPQSESQAAAVEFLRTQRYGVLATHSQAVPGYPFGSVTPYIVTGDGELAILISTIAQHTMNILADPRVSLTVFDPGDAEDPQAGSRLTWLADATPVANADLSAIERRYLRHFPAAASYERTHDFNYYRLRAVRLRLIGGFGKIHWLEPAQVCLENRLARWEEDIIDHMTQDHAPALKLIAAMSLGYSPTQAAMTGIDDGGMDLLCDGASARIAFPGPVTDSEQARRVLVDLTRRARGVEPAPPAAIPSRAAD